MSQTTIRLIGPVWLVLLSASIVGSGCSGNAPSNTAAGGAFTSLGGSSNSGATGGVSSSDTGGDNPSGGAPQATGGALTTGGAGNGGTRATGGTVGAAGGSAGASTTVGGSVGVRWLGRVVPTDANTARFAWQGAGLIATVSGATIAVKLRTEGTDTVYFLPVIDGVAQARFNVNSGSDAIVTLATGLSSADHQVELYRETEGRYGMSTFLGFTSGTVKGAPASNARLVEVVGDSISAGYGDLGSELHPNGVANPACHWTAANSSWYASYAALAGHALNAEVSTVAVSGWGMARDRDNNTSNVLPQVYANALGTGDTTAWTFSPKASVVVINLGTNDWNSNGDPGVAYETAYISFIGTLRSKYPAAWIFLTIGPMTGDPDLAQVKTRLANVVASVTASTGDSKLATFDFGKQNLGTNGEIASGCDWHPSVNEHKRMAAILQQQLSAKLGW